MKRVVVIGAGPIGIEAALLATARGHQVSVLEKDRIGSSLLSWGTTRFFSPFEMNVSARMRELLGSDAPQPGALLTGVDFVESVLKRCAARAPLAGKVLEKHAVVAVGRARMLRKDMPGHPLRQERGFVLLVDTPRGEQRIEADAVLDASGAQIPAYVGAGGIPALGEREVALELVRTLGALHARKDSLSGKSILVIGHGHSAANAIELLARIPGARITWATRSLNKKPCVAVADDPLPERKQIVDRANELAMHPPPSLAVERRSQVEAIAKRDGRLQVTLTGGRIGSYDLVCGFTGYRPDLSFLSELPVAISRVTEGAAGIDAKLGSVSDCLNVPRLTESDLASGEPGFHLIGHKSYGRSSTFLLKDGIRQLETILEGL